MLFRNAVTRLKLSALLAFIVMNLASMDLKAISTTRIHCHEFCVNWYNRQSWWIL